MSITCNFLVLLLSLSIHGSNARKLGVTDKISSLESIISIKVGLVFPRFPFSRFPAKAMLTKVQLTTESTDQGRSGTNGELIDDKVKGTGSTPQKPEDSKASSKDLKNIKGKIPGLVPVKPQQLVSVSRLVPQKNYDEHPGFYSDYSRPRTRPPSHN